MIKQTLHIDKYNWTAYVYYAVDSYYIEEILEKLELIGCSYKDVESTYEFMKDDKKDQGFTYSNYSNCESVLVVGLSSNRNQFVNTFFHELTHLATHIAKYHGFFDSNEEFAYLCGDIAEKMYIKAKSCFCNCSCC